MADCGAGSSGVRNERAARGEERAMTRPPVAVMQFPGTNCEHETLRAVDAAGGDGAIVRWNEPAGRLARFAAFVLPGGFAYQDRVRAGSIAAKDAIVEALAGEAERGKPVLGICNGAQILVEAGLVPAIHPGSIEMALAPNRMDGRRGYYSRLCYLVLTSEPERSPFTFGLTRGEVLPMPMAHGEGRFTTRSEEVIEEIRALSLVAFAYCAPDGSAAGGFPRNPNGSLEDAAGLTNPGGNVLALMPHPERAAAPWLLSPLAAARHRERWSVDLPAAPGSGGGPGGRIFEAMIRWLRRA